MSLKPGWMLAAIVILAGAGVWFCSEAPPTPPAPPRDSRLASAPGPAPPPAGADCDTPRFAAAAAANAQSLHTLVWSPFGPSEVGWETYWPVVAREIGTPCAPGDPDFAAALALWQAAKGLAPDGVLTPAAFEVMRVAQHRRRPFVVAFAKGCPAAADPAALAPARPDEGYSGKAVSVRRDVLDAYRRMVAAARAEVPELRGDRSQLSIFSGYRSPDEAAARCAGRDCAGVRRALCSAHQTGTALDLFVGHAPGLRPESTEAANRLHQSRTPAYRWMVANAARFGFVPYVYEPWHWEWAGAPL